jgi:signal transduction histidine kinase
MRRALLTLAIALVASCTIVWLSGGGTHGVLVTLAVIVPVAALALIATRLADGVLPVPSKLRPRTLRQRFGLGLAIALGQLLVALGIGAATMFVSDEDAWTAVAILVFCAAVAGIAARMLLRPVLADVQEIGEGLRAVQEGAREVHIQASSSRELGSLAQAANRMIESLSAEERARDDADAARRQVIAAVSHDLRTPLTSLRLLTQALDDDLVDGETARGYVRTMGANVRALGTLVDDLFEFSRLNAGDFSWSTQEVPISELVQELLEAMRAQAEARRVAVSAEVDPKLAPARANPERLARVLTNLLANAIHHTPPDGSVYIRAQRAGADAQIEVADTGCGIDASDRPRVFDPFYRGGADAARTRSGSGLGLAIARAIVEAHGGQIWLADAGQGTSVRFTVPLAR